MLGRTFSDYKKYVENHPDDNIFQYDSVEGKIDDKKQFLLLLILSLDFNLVILYLNKI